MNSTGRRRFAIVGDPVMHSMSPAIHTAGYAAYDIDAVFEHLPTTADQFGRVVAALRAGELAGVNVTMPHKERAFAAVDDLDEVARRSRAVNTIVVNDGRLVGYNTDVVGVQVAGTQAGFSDSAPVLVLGAGGAAAAAVVAMADRSLFVSARNQPDARELLERTLTEATVVSWGEGVAGAIVVNATPLGMRGEELPGDVLVVGSGLLDMTYGQGQTTACELYRRLGLPCADGFDMLVAQAGSAFELFTGIAPDLDIFRLAIKGS
ncbi:MAG: hypothetical protein DWP92_08960 [Armatimonadetes bacterium]|nr:MAG: hypothetical protein DWP92_08960 [Armatimonadota bacterium]